MKNNIKYILFIFTVLFFLASCDKKHADGDGHNHNSKVENHSDRDGHDHKEKEKSHSDDDGHGHGDQEEHGEHVEEGLHLTKEQIETIGLEFGDFSAIKVNDFINATGTLGLPPNAYSSVSAKGAGIIKGSKKYVEGNYIKKGEIIAHIENPDFIIKQQEYLEAKAQLKLKKLDLNRQQALIDANAGVSKNLQNAETEVEILEAKSMSLSKQLSYLGISTTNLSPNSITQQIAIIAPMSGYISSINMHNGMYAQPMVSLMEIISENHLHLELDVFEKNIGSLKVGQKISYTVPALGNTQYNGEVSIIGKEFDAKSKTVRIHGHLDGVKPTFLKDLFINAKIWLNDNTVNAIPEASVIKDGATSFIYVAKNEKELKEIEFSKISVIPGATNNGFTAIKLLSEIPEGMEIVTKGAYYVYAQSQAGELEHEH